MSEAARYYDQSKPPKRFVVSISAFMSGRRFIGTISSLPTLGHCFQSDNVWESTHSFARRVPAREN